MAMLIELLSLLFHIYWWMKWLQNEGLLPETDALPGKEEDASDGQ